MRFPQLRHRIATIPGNIIAVAVILACLIALGLNVLADSHSARCTPTVEHTQAATETLNC